VANLGDSRALVYNKKKKIIPLSNPHDLKNKLEEEEVDQKGGLILKNRLNGVLQITRSIGDKDFKAYMRSDPEIIEHVIDDDDLFLIVATDGIWNDVTT